MGAGRQYGRSVRQVLAPEGILLSDADQISRRAYVYLLPLRKLRSPVERKLIENRPLALSRSMMILLLCFYLAFANIDVTSANSALSVPEDPFLVVVFTCIHGRPLLTRFVLNHYALLRDSILRDFKIALHIFITGTDPLTTKEIAKDVGAGFSTYPNSPLGAKHNSGLRAIRAWYDQERDRCKDLPILHSGAICGRSPHAIVVIGSDDLLNARYFIELRNRLQVRNGSLSLKMLGLRDLYVYDLSSSRLVYTRGYRKSSNDVSATIGCGRAFTWSLMEEMNWELWDNDRDRSLDQSAVRRITAAVGNSVTSTCKGISGHKIGVVAVDIKSAGVNGGSNIWTFESIVEAVGSKGPLHRFRDVDAEFFFEEYFGEGFTKRLNTLRDRMLSYTKPASTDSISKSTVEAEEFSSTREFICPRRRHLL